jgi:hypothetical protein
VGLLQLLGATLLSALHRHTVNQFHSKAQPTHHRAAAAAAHQLLQEAVAADQRKGQPGSKEAKGQAALDALRREEAALNQQAADLASQVCGRVARE